MPEGDTIFLIAKALRPLLVGAPLVEASTRVHGRLASLIGKTTTSVEAHGKHLLITFETGDAVRVHLRMNGYWRWYPGKQNWRPPTAEAALVLTTEDYAVACFRTNHVELHSAAHHLRLGPISRLGPDLITHPSSAEEIAERARAMAKAGATISEVLLDQNIAAGVGNIFRCEILFLCGVHPETPLRSLNQGVLEEVYATAKRELSRNTQSWPRSTRSDSGVPDAVWVYERQGAPCLRCGHPIQSAFLGSPQRLTYWCNRCQPPPLQ